MIAETILRNLINKKIDIYVRDLGQYSRFQGILASIADNMVLLRSRYNKLVYIPITEIVIITEYDVKSKFIEENLEDIAVINPTA